MDACAMKECSERHVGLWCHCPQLEAFFGRNEQLCAALEVLRQ